MSLAVVVGTLGGVFLGAALGVLFTTLWVAARTEDRK